MHRDDETTFSRAGRFGAAVVIAFALGGAIGRAFSPTRTIEKIVTVERAQAAEVKRETAAVTATKARTTAARVVEESLRPDGSVSKRRTTETRSEARAQTAAQTDTQEARVVVQEKIVEREKLIAPALPDWSVSAHGGLNLTGGRPVVGAGLDRRIGGGFWVGVWADSSGTVGLRARLDF